MALQAPLSFDIDALGTIDHDFGDGRILQQGLQRSQPDGLVQHALAQGFAVHGFGNRHLPVAQQARQQCRSLLAQHRIGHGGDIPPPQVQRLDQGLVQRHPAGLPCLPIHHVTPAGRAFGPRGHGCEKAQPAGPDDDDVGWLQWTI